MSRQRPLRRLPLKLHRRLPLLRRLPAGVRGFPGQLPAAPFRLLPQLHRLLLRIPLLLQRRLHQPHLPRPQDGVRGCHGRRPVAGLLPLPKLPPPRKQLLPHKRPPYRFRRPASGARLRPDGLHR